MKAGAGRSCYNAFKLTCAEIRVLQTLVKGLRRGEISKQLSISSHTADSHLASAYGKLEVHNEADAIGKLLSEGNFGLVQIRASQSVGKDEKSMNPLIAQTKRSI